jgi:hypothetical protein
MAEEESISLIDLLAWFLELLDNVTKADVARFEAHARLVQGGPFEETRDEYWRITLDVQAAVKQLAEGAQIIGVVTAKAPSEYVRPGWRNELLQQLPTTLDALMDVLLWRPWPGVPHEYSNGRSIEAFNALVEQLTTCRRQLIDRALELAEYAPDASDVSGEVKPERRSRVARKVEQATRIISALREHHRYDSADYNHVPISNADLARKTQLSESMISRWFASKFDDGRDSYLRICAANGVHKWLESLSGETSFGTAADLDAVSDGEG